MGNQKRKGKRHWKKKDKAKPEADEQDVGKESLDFNREGRVTHGSIFINNRQVTQVTNVRQGYDCFLLQNDVDGYYWDYDPKEKLNFRIQIDTPDKHLYITSIIMIFD